MVWWNRHYTLEFLFLISDWILNRSLHGLWIFDFLLRQASRLNCWLAVISFFPSTLSLACIGAICVDATSYQFQLVAEVCLETATLVATIGASRVRSSSNLVCATGLHCNGGCWLSLVHCVVYVLPQYALLIQALIASTRSQVARQSIFVTCRVQIGDSTTSL